MMKKLVLLALAAPSIALAQSYPSPVFNSLTVNSLVSGSGFSSYLASPPAIGGTTPNAIKATAFNQANNLTSTGISGNCTNTIPSTNYCVNYLTLGLSTFDNGALTDPTAFVNEFALLHNYGGTQMTGGRQTFYVQSTLASPSNASNGNRNYVAGVFYAQAASGDNGTSPSSNTTAKGAIFSLNPVAVAYNGATNLLELTGAEFDMSAQAGSSMWYKTGLSIVQIVGDAVQGTVYDGALSISNANGTSGWKNGILFSPANGAFPIASSGCLICSSGSGTAASGINFSGLTLTNFLVGPGGYSVSGTGQTFTSALSSTGPVTATSGTFSSSLSAAYSGAGVYANDTSAASTSNFILSKNGTNVWDLYNTSSSGTLNLGRFVSGTLTDNPISVSNSTGLVTFADGISSASVTSTGAVSGTTGTFSGAVSGTTGTFSGVVNPQAGTQASSSGSAPACASGLVGSVCTATTSGTSLTTGVTAAITSVSLPAGNWDVTCSGQFTPSSTVSSYGIGIASSATSLGGLGASINIGASFTSGFGATWATPEVRVSLSSTTTYYCTANTVFSGTMTANGYINAKRTP